MMLTSGRALLFYLVLFPLAMSAEALAASSSEENPRLWKPRITSVAVFKEDWGFFTREGEVEVRDGWCYSRDIPPAAFGTLALYSLSEDQIVDIVGSGPGEIIAFDDIDAPSTLDAKRGRLGQCVNLTVELSYEYQGQPRTSAGKLVSVADTFAILESADAQTAVPVEAVSQVQIKDLPLRIHITGSDRKPINGTVNLGMAYLRQGITWLPDYSYELTDEKQGKLNLRGTLVNAAEDLIHTDVSFVVGVPHFAHRDYLAPLAVGQIIRTVGSALAPATVGNQILNRAAIATNNDNGMNDFELISGLRDGGEIGAMVGSVPDMPASVSSADYTYHTIPDLTIRRGEKAIVNLYTGVVRYSHLYRWDVPSNIQHVLVMLNESDTAWTTGPCLAVRGRRPLSEDLLKYTPKGGRSELPIGTAININHRQSEKETDRRAQAYEKIIEYAHDDVPKRSEFWDLVTLEGTLQIKNYEPHPANVIVTQNVKGKPLSASHDGETRLDTGDLQLMARSGSVRWEVEVSPGEATTLTYTYERYVKSP